MATGYVLCNKQAGLKNVEESQTLISSFLGGELKFIDVTEIEDYKTFLGGLEKNDYIVLAGGDGTINRFVNNVEGLDYDGEILYFPSGSGNDFAADLGYVKNAQPFSIKEFIKDLPMVEVNGKKYRFINGVGYGIDGYCCEVGDKQKATSDKPINYTSIAIKGLLFHYKPTNATVTVDGVAHAFKKVWLAPTMYGRYYGGGMIPTPQQTRENKDTLSTLVFYGSGKLKTLMIFPSLFKGAHVKYEKNIAVLQGKEITVTFDKPTALQIDGETILGVTSYTAYAPNTANK